MKTKINYVSLTGGLGNQLFQFAAGRSCSSSDPLYLISCLGVPRTTRIEPDICDFELGNGVKLLTCNHRHLLSKKVFNFLMSMTVGRRRWVFNTPPILKIVSAIANLIFRIELRIFSKIFVSNGIGYSRVSSNSAINFPVGYFQTYRSITTGEMFRFNSEIRLKTKNPTIELLREEAIELNPLIVHVRLGDYKNETSFGILGGDYYESAIDSQLDDKRIKEIWLFSDETDLAISRIPKRYLPMTRVMNLEGFSPAQVLEVMRLGHSYVIANSTFSWWGAFLSYRENPRVIAPDRWFIKLDEPLDLVPISWERFPCKLDLEIG